MKSFKTQPRVTKKRILPKRLLWLALSLLVVIVGATWLEWRSYKHNLEPVSNSQQTQLVTIVTGASVKQIGDLLQTKHLIRSHSALAWYVHSKELSGQLQAGTYALSPSQSTPAIVRTLTKGAVNTKLVTILPGRRIDQIKADLINEGFSPGAVEAALNPGPYGDLAALAYKPANITNLEGLLYPDSFQKTADTDPVVIIRESLMEMENRLTPDLQAAFAKQGLSTYQGIILASIVGQEVSKQSDRSQVAQVFLSRLSAGMVLGSDVTANYGAIAAGRPPSLGYDSPYNTLLHPGLPPSPISNVNDSTLQAVAHPAGTDWLYFVSGDDGMTHFSKTFQEHQALTAQYCHKLCSRQ